jgi:hypothetical protein
MGEKYPKTIIVLHRVFLYVRKSLVDPVADHTSRWQVVTQLDIVVQCGFHINLQIFIDF